MPLSQKLLWVGVHGKKQLKTLELFLRYAAVIIDVTPKDKALEVKKSQNNHFWQKQFFTNNSLTKRYFEITLP